MNAAPRDTHRPPPPAPAPRPTRLAWLWVALIGLPLLTIFGVLTWWCTSDVTVIHLDGLRYGNVAAVEGEVKAMVGRDVWDYCADEHALGWTSRSTENELRFEPGPAFESIYWGIVEGDLLGYLSRGYDEYVFPTDPDWDARTWVLPVAHPAGEIHITLDAHSDRITAAKFTPASP